MYLGSIYAGWTESLTHNSKQIKSFLVLLLTRARDFISITLTADHMYRSSYTSVFT